MALGQLGTSPVDNIDGTAMGLASMRNNYNLLRRNLLSKVYWDFAIKRANLALSADTPADDEWLYKHTKPADFIVLKDIYNIDLHEIENDGILSNSEIMKIEYLADITDTTKFSPGFAMVLAYDLALASGSSALITASARQQMMQERERLFRDAKKSDAKQAAVINTKFIDTYWNRHENSED